MSFTQTEPLRPQLFVTRQNGTMIPLVAVDELPSTMSIRGVPRTLSPHDISGMTGVGTFNSRHRQYVIDGDRSLMGSSFAMPTTRPPKNDLPWAPCRTSVFPTPSVCPTPPVFPTPPKAYGIEEQPPSTPKTPFANMPPSTSEPSDLPPFHNLDELPIGRAPGIKEYCSYWLRHGECDYAQQGCLYRHEMPLDRSTLEKLGLRDIPRWYREKHRLGSYLAGGNNISGINAPSPVKPGLMERNWRSHAAEAKPAVLTPKPAVSTSKPAVLTPQPTYHAILSRHQPSSTKAKTTSASEEESVSARQLRETIRMLDIYDERERERLSEKYQTLKPQKGAPPVLAKTPSTASSTTGGTETEELPEEVVATKEASKSIAPSVLISTPSCPKPASIRPSPMLKKRAGRPKRRGNNGREGRILVDGSGQAGGL